MNQRIRKILSCLTLCALLAALWQVPAAAAGGIADVPEDFWAAGDIQRAVEEGYFFLEDGGTFGTGKEMTRAEAVVVLCRFFGWKPTLPPRQVYQDVPENLWYAGAVEAAFLQGAITIQGGEFHPDKPAARQDLAAMLVRALGYGTFAGLAQDLSLPFQDVKANTGYIAIAYGLGLMDGATVSTFAPEAPVLREQMAVILMRLHDKLYGEPASGRAGILSSADNLPDLKGYEAVAISALRLAYNGSPQLSLNMEDEEVQRAREAAKEAKVPQLLHVSGGPYQLRENAEEMAAVLLEAVKEGGYDGLFLDISGLTTTPQRNELTAVAAALREGLGKKLLYMAAETPSWHGRLPGYDYASLGEYVDRLVLKIDSPVEHANGIVTAPPEPLEEIYFALNRMRGLVDAGKLSLMVTTHGTAWGEESEGEIVTGGEIAELMAEQWAKVYYSDRYACAYLETADETTAVWYLNGQSIQERNQLARLFGVDQLCAAELDDALPELVEALP
ncbi:MAG: hypothetical protein HFF90_04490 [Oscillibacter sp.]|nr:hypothetical protein [Oscillibacter sp.]